LTDGAKAEIQLGYRQGESLGEIADRLKIKKNTIEKAVRQKRILLIGPDIAEEGPKVLNKSDRSTIDDHTGMGKACGNAVGRVLACVGGKPATPRFDPQIDLHQAGVLLGIPALLSNGLLAHSGDFKLDRVYCSEESIFLCLAFLSLLRIRNLNQVDHVPCGELGRALGLDRIPEVKTLRERIAGFVERGDVGAWSRKLSRGWMAANKDLAGVLYIDGHVNIYYGHATQMPKRYVSRLRLCMAGSTDYYVNDRTGQPFFVVNEVIDSGMIERIKTSILPRLEREVPDQPTEAELQRDPRSHRFMIVFDRECYSIDFFHYLEEKRIAFCSYNKNVRDQWPEGDFTEYEAMDERTGSVEKMRLAEKETVLKDRDAKNPKGVTVREIRKLTASGHQTSILTTNRILAPVQIGLYMFARWCQENFFKYMRENFDIDGLVSYSKAQVGDTRTLVNPQYRQLDGKVRSLNGKLARQKAKFGGMALKEASPAGKKLEKAIAKKAHVLEEIQILEGSLAAAKEKRKNTERKITFAQLPAEEQFTNAINDRKYFLDHIKMIAFRAETSMYNLIRHRMNPHHSDEGRKLLQQIYTPNADIVPDYRQKTLTVKIHHLNYRRDNKVLEYLCDKLNETETEFPGTELRIIYKLVSS